MGPRFDRLRYEVFQNLFLSPMNTGSVRPAVATTPTARGIETPNLLRTIISFVYLAVATTPTARGIETQSNLNYMIRILSVATTPTARGIETHSNTSSF